MRFYVFLNTFKNDRDAGGERMDDSVMLQAFAKFSKSSLKFTRNVFTGGSMKHNESSRWRTKTSDRVEGCFIARNRGRGCHPICPCMPSLLECIQKVEGCAFIAIIDGWQPPHNGPRQIILCYFLLFRTCFFRYRRLVLSGATRPISCRNCNFLGTNKMHWVKSGAEGKSNTGLNRRSSLWDSVVASEVLTGSTAVYFGSWNSERRDVSTTIHRKCFGLLHTMARSMA